MNVAAVPAAPTQKYQFTNGEFADARQVPLVFKQHKLYFGDHQGSFASFGDALEAARTMSAGPEPATVVTSHPDFDGTYTKESTPFNVYEVLDVEGPRITNPVVGWKPWNTTARPFHADDAAMFGYKATRPGSLVPQLQDIVVVDGDVEVPIAPRR